MSWGLVLVRYETEPLQRDGYEPPTRCRCRRSRALEDVVRAMSVDAAKSEVTDSEREDAARQAGREDLSPRHRGNLQARARDEVV